MDGVAGQRESAVGTLYTSGNPASWYFCIVTVLDILAAGLVLCLWFTRSSSKVQEREKYSLRLASRV